jgi:arginyl-tRNA synthetase
MNPLAHVQDAFVSFLKTHYALDDQQALACSFVYNVDPQRQDFGDLNSNAAMVLAKVLRDSSANPSIRTKSATQDDRIRNPRELAQEITTTFRHPYLARLEIAGPGFINAFLTPQAFIDLAQELHKGKYAFFKLDEDAPKHRYNIEFVSANPTGPLHLGHGRGGIIGDVLGNILKFIGHTVTKEFYINDAGNQIQKLGASFKVRCLQALGISAELPEDGYRGEYLVALANECIAQYGNDLAQKP